MVIKGASFESFEMKEGGKVLVRERRISQVLSGGNEINAKMDIVYNRS